MRARSLTALTAAFSLAAATVVPTIDFYSPRQFATPALEQTAPMKLPSLGVPAFIQQVTDIPYFTHYSDAGLYAVLDGATRADYQHHAARLLSMRMDTKRYQSMFMYGNSLATFGRPATIDDFLASAEHPVILRRGTQPYEALLREIPAAQSRELVREYVKTIILHPNARTALDSTTFDSIGTVVFNDIAIVEASKTSDVQLLAGVLVHEASHLSMPQTTSLVTERAAYSRQLQTLRSFSHPSAKVRETIPYLERVVGIADYLSQDIFGNAFANVYPRPEADNLAETLRGVHVPAEVLRNFLQVETENEQFDEVLRASVGKVLFVPGPMLPAPAAPSTDKPAPEPIIPDPGARNLTVVF